MVVGRLAVAGVAVAVLVICLYHVYQPPVPEGFAEPWKLEVAFRLIKLAKRGISLWEEVGLGPNYPISKRIWNDGESLKVWVTGLTVGHHEGLEVTDREFDGVHVRLYMPAGKVDQSPGFVFFHGGGWTIGGVDAYDSYIRKVSSISNIPVASVEYRLAPVHPYPAGLNDCVAATEFFIKNAAMFGVDPLRVAIGGDSAGGNLAAAVALRMRDEGFTPKVKMQVLVYPALQAFDMMTPSFQQNRHNTIVNPKDVAVHWLYYLQGHSDNYEVMLQNGHVSSERKLHMASSHLDTSKLPSELISEEFVPPSLDHGNETLYQQLQHLLMDPYVNPLIAQDLTGLPITYMFTAENDVLRDEGVLFAQRLEEAGVAVTHRHSLLAFHGILQFHDFIDEGHDLTTEMIEFVNTYL